MAVDKMRIGGVRARRTIDEMKIGGLGTRRKRVEGPRLIRGTCSYLDDFKLCPVEVPENEAFGCSIAW